MKDIVITGSVAYDYLMTFPGYFKEHILVDRIESISLSFLVDTMVRERGGCAANIAYGLALFGVKPRMMAAVGQDFGDYRQWLKNKGWIHRDLCSCRINLLLPSLRIPIKPMHKYAHFIQGNGKCS
jgi:sugar/nucleoside kinase (ribokinase family)